MYVRRASWWFFGAIAASGSGIAHEICELAYRREFNAGQPPGHSPGRGGGDRDRVARDPR